MIQPRPGPGAHAANAPPLGLASRNCAPSRLTVASDTSATIASTTTCSRRVSSWRTTSDSWRWISAGAAITIALAPVKRVTTAAVRPPCVVSAA